MQDEHRQQRNEWFGHHNQAKNVQILIFLKRISHAFLKFTTHRAHSMDVVCPRAAHRLLRLVPRRGVGATQAMSGDRAQKNDAEDKKSYTLRHVVCEC